MEQSSQAKPESQLKLPPQIVNQGCKNTIEIVVETAENRHFLAKIIALKSDIR